MSTIDEAEAGRPSDGYFNLGTYTRKITTISPDAQLWFDRGLIWTYGFNMREAAECFEKVIAADPDCAMGYWGIAFTSGPYYNKAWRLFDPNELLNALKVTYQASQQAIQRVKNASPVEAALIHALAQRHPQMEPPKDLGVWSQKYADAMEMVFKQFSDDIDVAVLCADALMVLTPWALWNAHTGKPRPGSRALDAKAVADHAFTLSGAQTHPGLLHLHIHLMEMSPTPEEAVPSADLLRNLVPEAGHLRHMPSHIDVMMGDYRSAIAANAAAVVQDAKFLKKIGGKNLFTFYRVHDYHSLIYAAMLAGQSEVSLRNCIEMEKSLPEDLLEIESPPMADWLEAFLAVRAHVLIRFGRWQDILDIPVPTNQKLYCVTLAVLHYARGIAFAATGDIASAKESQKLFREAQARVPPTRYDYPVRVIDALAVAEEMLAGELEYRRGNYDIAFSRLRKAIELDDNLTYSEPWGWMLPTRHSYAALMLEQDHVEEAAVAYAEDLGFTGSLPRGHQHPNNVWALRGYVECLERLGRTVEKDMLTLPLKLAMSVADVQVESSCFCKGAGKKSNAFANGNSCH